MSLVWTIYWNMQNDCGFHLATLDTQAVKQHIAFAYRFAFTVGKMLDMHREHHVFNRCFFFRFCAWASKRRLFGWLFRNQFIVRAFNVAIGLKLFVWERDQPSLTWPISTVLSISLLLVSTFLSSFAEMENSSIALCRAVLRIIQVTFIPFLIILRVIDAFRAEKAHLVLSIYFIVRQHLIDWHQMQFTSLFSPQIHPKMCTICIISNMFAGNSQGMEISSALPLVRWCRCWLLLSRQARAEKKQLWVINCITNSNKLIPWILFIVCFLF